MNPVPIYNTRTLPTNYMCANQDCISSAVKSTNTTLRVLSGSSCPPSHSTCRIRHSLLMPEFFFHSLFYPPPRASIQFSLPCHFPALPQWFSCVGHYHFSEDNLSTLVVKHETEVSRKSSDKSMSADNYCSSRITDNKLHAKNSRQQNKAHREFAFLIGRFNPIIYNCFDNPPAPKALNEFSGRTSQLLSTTCDECTFLGLHVSSSKASATSLHLSPKKEAPCTPRTKAQQKSEATLSRWKCTLWWSALLGFSPVELPSAF